MGKSIHVTAVTVKTAGLISMKSKSKLPYARVCTILNLFNLFPAYVNTQSLNHISCQQEVKQRSKGSLKNDIMQHHF